MIIEELSEVWFKYGSIFFVSSCEASVRLVYTHLFRCDVITFPPPQPFHEHAHFSHTSFELNLMLCMSSARCEYHFSLASLIFFYLGARFFSFFFSSGMGLSPSFHNSCSNVSRWLMAVNIESLL